MKNGLYSTITPAQYFDDPCPEPSLTASGCGLLIYKTPRHFAFDHPKLPPFDAEYQQATKEMYFGSVVHRLTLGKGADYEVVDAKDWRTKAAQRQRDDAIEAGRIPILHDRFAAAKAMASRLIEAVEVETGGSPYQTELVVISSKEVNGRPIYTRSMVDFWFPEIGRVIDIKTCKSADDQSLLRAFDRGLARQRRFYLDNLNRCLPEREGRIEFSFLFVEAEPPHAERWAVPSGAFDAGAEIEVAHAEAIFANCMATGRWPGWKSARVEPRGYSQQRWEEMTLEWENGDD